jgi:hypothetical protein
VDAASTDLIKQVAGAVLIGAFQGYNIWQHRKNAKKISETQTVVAANYDALTADFQVARDAIERMGLTMTGVNDRRKAAPLLSADEAIRARAAGFGRRWTDPTTPRPPDAGPPPSGGT